MVQAGINSNGKIELVPIQEHLTGQQGIDKVLFPHVTLTCLRTAIGDEFIFMHDNTTSHTARISTTFLEEQDIEIMDWQARSPDMNPIENLWDQVKCKADKLIKADTTVAQPGGIIQPVWTSIPQPNITTSVNSMPKCCNQVIQMNGGNTDY